MHEAAERSKKKAIGRGTRKAFHAIPHGDIALDEATAEHRKAAEATASTTKQAIALAERARAESDADADIRITHTA